MTPDPASTATSRHRRAAPFPTTHWSMIAHAASGADARAQAALESLCRRYWYPLYSYVRRSGRAHHEAEDCTQEFLARLLAAGGIARARPDRGRFRTFMLTALRNFLINDWQHAQAAKRGGGQQPVSLDFAGADVSYRHEPADAALTPEQAFDRTWALGLIQGAIGEVRGDYEQSGRGALFAALLPFVWGERIGETLAAPAARLGMTTHAFTVALQRVRQRIALRLRIAVAATVASDADIDAELRHLITAVGGLAPDA